MAFGKLSGRKLNTLSTDPVSATNLATSKNLCWTGGNPKYFYIKGSWYILATGRPPKLYIKAFWLLPGLSENWVLKIRWCIIMSSIQIAIMCGQKKQWFIMVYPCNFLTVDGTVVLHLKSRSVTSFLLELRRIAWPLRIHLLQHGHLCQGWHTQIPWTFMAQEK